MDTITGEGKVHTEYKTQRSTEEKKNGATNTKVKHTPTY